MDTALVDSIEQTYLTLGVYLDPEKAFDTVNHKILRNKLKQVGIRGKLLNWLKTYLMEDRKAKVKIGCRQSGIPSVVNGVPTG